MNILSKINGLDDFKKLNLLELKKLSSEIRKFLIEKVSVTGGHLASNLGVVELTIALHKVFNSPEDKIIWDVGHQAYVHKILTGRKEQFDTLRQFKGLSGFPKIKESIHDSFETGHSSTSISAGLGMALARDLKGEKYSIISVIGDGALTGGMAFEALNHAGHSKTDFIVVLNDNEMSISENVGGLSKYLNRIRTAPTYFKVKDDVESLLRKIPAIGESVVRTAQKTKDTIKYFFVPGIIFEELGFTYLGPVNGHNIEDLIEVFKRAKNIKGPILVHVKTRKGKGYSFAEKHPDKFHGIGPFNIQTGKKLKVNSSKTYSEIFGEILVKLAEKDSRIVAITAAMPSGTGLSLFASKFPERFYDVGIAEQHAVTFAAGLAANGIRPVFAVYSTFLQRGYDQIIHDVCLQNLPVVFAIDRAGIVGQDGETHHGVFDLSYLRHIPNLKILAPKDGKELEKMLEYAFKQESPIAIRYPRGVSEDLCIDEKNNVDRAEILRKGKDVCIIAIGKMVKTGLEVSKLLEKEGIMTTVINSRFVKPLDKDTILNEIKNIDTVITLEDNVKSGGFGCGVLELLNENGIKGKKFKIFGFPDKFVEHGSVDVLFKEYKLDFKSIALSILELLKKKEI
ncbi:1-deoxy-D-xylulose-5-phosphate synthase [Caminicella sporogenes DSM 14501]|uniref:1-deoxy-D-xylulose-5-phosphate synthase n=1 Tax=Caminicella sporogenes DSM 14501 TaxID=1121266 RepID=A0A1M6LLF7_9FIRM|nr:1-deoxy-D-xylulose-5-phosphate synthase [Caminicella sporogenes]SHJ71980.1 1-deoxy-D-xylulose-5-phosphate synthase [Caminicella sporogenes DSM 14501]